MTMKNITIIFALLLGCTKNNKLPNPVDPRAENQEAPAAENPLPDALPGPPPSDDAVPEAKAVDGPLAPNETAAPKPVAQTAGLDDELSASSRVCNDGNFGKAGLEACVKVEAEGEKMSRFSSVTLLFSLLRTSGKAPEELYATAVERNFSFVDAKGNAVPGSLIWKDARTLQFDPKGELLPDATYTLTIASKAKDAGRPRSNQGRILLPFQFSLKTQAAFLMSHSLNGQALPEGKGLMLNASNARELRLQSHLEEYKQASKLSLRRLGSQEALTLCQGNCEKADWDVKLEGSVLAPEPGLNSYEYAIIGRSGETVYRHLSFGWGDISTNALKAILGGVHAALDRENGLKAMSNLVGNFAAGRFTMDYRDADGSVTPKQTFNDIIRNRRAQFRDTLPDDCDSQASADFEYLQNLGPFCNLQVSGSTPILGGFAGNVQYKAVTDIYVTEMEVVQEEGNVDAKLIPGDAILQMHLGAKKFKGRLKIVLRIDEAKYIFGIAVPGATGYHYYDTDFQLDGPMRETIAKADVSVENGRLKLRLHGLESFDMEKTIQGSEDSRTYFNTKSWTDAVVVSKPTAIDERQGLWAKLVNFIVNQAVNEQVPHFKPQIVNGIARDILQVVAPNTLNTLVEQLRSGLQVFLPAHLPSPLDRTKLQLAGQVGDRLGFAMREFNSYLTAPIHMSLKTLLSNPNARPVVPQGVDGFFKTKNGAEAPSPLTATSNSEAGSLLAVSLDVTNQTLYDVWKQGVLNLNINEAFIDKVKEFAVLDPTKENNGREILLAEFLPKLLGSDITRMTGIGEDGKPISMVKSDKISIVIDPRLPPHLTVKKAPRNDGYYDLRFALALSDVSMRIQGEHQGRRYTIAHLRLAMTADSTLGFVPYKNPMRQPQFSGLGALSVAIDSDPAGLDYMIEVQEGTQLNSFGIDTGRLRNTVADMVDQLFIPLMNDALREVPLTGLRACGVELDAGAMKIMPLPDSIETPFLLIKAPLKNYAFSGHCDLLPDLTSPLPPLPPPTEEPEEEGEQPQNPGQPSGQSRVELDMDFSKIPWTLNGQGTIPELTDECKSQIFFDVSCPVAQVVYEMENGALKLDERGRPIYSHTHIVLATLVPKDVYKLSGAAPSIESQFFDFARWSEYVQGAEDSVIFNDSQVMPDIETQYGVFRRHYADFESNSPKASGFIPLREVALHRILEKPFQGAEVTTEFFVDTSPFVAVPAGRKAMKGAEGLDFHVGNTHIIDCGKVSWCQDSGQWLVIYDSLLRPEDKSIPEDVVPYLKAALNAIIAGMFPLDP